MKPNSILLVILAISVVLSGYSTFLEIREMSIGTSLEAAWAVAFAFLVTFWARNDAAKQHVHRSLDFSFYFLALWPVALPYYLIKTRGVEGIVYFFGLAVLYFAPFLFGLIAYTYWVPE